MTNPLRFSVLVLPNVPWPELLRRCRQVEELGFNSVGLADHLVDWAGGKGPWFELWSQLAAIAQATTRIRLTTLVAQIPLRNPVLLALQALTADHISGGRLDVGLGIGLEVDPAYRMMGIDNWSAKERVARFGEYVEIVDRLLSQEETSFQGHFYKVDAAALRPRPVQSPRPPIVIAAMGPVMLGHAARHADIWNSISFAKTFEAQLDETRERVAAIDARCARIGRDPATLAAFLSHVRPDRSLERRQDQVLRVRGDLPADGGAGDRPRHLGGGLLLPHAGGAGADVRADRAQRAAGVESKLWEQPGREPEAPCAALAKRHAASGDTLFRPQ